jgi:hypothetical protein
MGCHSCKQPVKVNNENFVCYLCLENYPEYMHLPCGHYGICEICKKTLNKEENKYKTQCPICNKNGRIKKIYFQGNIENINQIENYILHKQQKENEILNEENRILKEINKTSKKLNKELISENSYYKCVSNQNKKNLKQIVQKYNEKIYLDDLKKNIYKIKKFKFLCEQRKIYNKLNKRDIYIIELIKKYKNEMININDLDNYLEDNKIKKIL